MEKDLSKINIPSILCIINQPVLSKQIYNIFIIAKMENLKDQIELPLTESSKLNTS